MGGILPPPMIPPLPTVPSLPVVTNPPPPSTLVGGTVAVPRGCSEFELVEAIFKRGQEVYPRHRVEAIIESLERIHNPDLVAKYKGSIYEQPLFHGTSKNACYSIAKTGYQMGTAGMLGGGIYFAPNPLKSQYYCDSNRMMLLSRVNLEGSEYAQNAIYQEYCIYSIKQAIPVYIITWKRR